tara:strand:- start:746 stop:1420 length:675 start_codon:yes stop_codon:yes gene_type:complete
MEINILPILICAVAFSGCSYSVTSHSFTYHGTDFPQSDKDFFYVDEGVFGSATAVYDYKGGGNMRDGLIADAKANLKMGQSLQPNQAYANLSIDIMETETGRRDGNYRNPLRFEVTAVITADIIQFGEQAPIQTSSSRSQGRIDELRESTSKTTIKGKASYDDNLYGVGDTVLIQLREEWRSAEVIEVKWMQSDRSFNYKVEYKIALGNHRNTYRSESAIRPKN